MPDAGSGHTLVRRLSRWLVRRLVRWLVRVIALVLAFVVLPSSAAPTEWGPIDLKSATVAPGTKLKFKFFAKQFFESGFLDTPLWAARGVKPGPTLCVISGIHGDEINSVEIARRSFQAVMPTRLAGTLIVVPEVNSLGFRNMNRYMIDRRDLNRAFPGTMRGSVTSQAARALFERVVRRCDYLIDLHTGSNFRSNVAQIRVDSSNPKSLALAENFGVGIIIEGRGPAGSLRREAVKAGVAAIIYEAGPPYTFVREEIEAGTRGILNVLDYLGMYASNQARTRSKKLKGSSWIRVPTGGGGIFLTEVALGDAVEAGDLLGTIADPDTDSVYEVRAHRPGIVIGVAQPQVVLSGYGIFHIGTFE